MHQVIYDHMKHHHKGKQKAISMTRLAYIFDVHERTLRKMISEIRQNIVKCNDDQGNVKIIGDSNGYYMIADYEEHRRLRKRVVANIRRNVELLKQIDGDNKEGQLAFDFTTEEIKIIKELDDNMKLLTLSELAKEMDISRPTLYKLIEQGMPYVQINKVKRFDAKEVETWLKKTTAQKV